MEQKSGTELYPELRKRIKGKYLTYGNFAKALGMTKQNLSRKLVGDTGFSSKDIEKWCRLLDIPVEKSGKYFF